MTKTTLSSAMTSERVLRANLAFLLVVVVLVAAACTGSDDPAPATVAVTTPTVAPSTTTSVPTTTSSTTTTSTTTTTTTTTLPPAELPTFADDDEEIPADPGVLIGTLASGLTYYIRENTAPGARAQLRLAVKAGSVQEVDDQRGALPRTHDVQRHRALPGQ